MRKLFFMGIMLSLAIIAVAEEVPTPSHPTIEEYKRWADQYKSPDGNYGVPMYPSEGTPKPMEGWIKRKIWEQEQEYKRKEQERLKNEKNN